MRVQISRTIVSNKVTIIPKGRFPKLKGSIYNLPIDTADIVDVISHGAESSDLKLIKLNCKLCYKTHVCFESAWPEYIDQALTYLKENNAWYSGFVIDLEKMWNSLLSYSL